MKIRAIIVVIAVLLAGCARKNDTTEAVKQGVIRDLATKFDMSKMDVIVDSVSFRDKEADATVTFAVKGMSASQGMTMNYVMERRGDNQWYIKSRSSVAAGAGGADGSAAAHAATGSNVNLPPGHPGLGQ